MGEGEALTIREATWSEAAQVALTDAAPYLGGEGLLDEYRRGARLFEVVHLGRAVAYYLLRVDHVFDGPEGVIMAAAGGLQGVDLTASVLPAIEKQFVGCVAVRIHTARAGLAKKLAAQGYGAGEIVLRKKL